MRRLFLRGGKGLTKGMGLSAVALLAALAPLVSSPVGLAAPPSLSGHIAASAQNFSAGPPTQANLTASGNEDWAIWGYAGGTSTSLAPDERKAGGNAISDLTDIQPGPPIARRGIGQFPSEVPPRFSWTDGPAPAPSASSVPAGLQHNTNLVDSSGYGFSFNVPASTVPQTLTVWAHAQGGVGRLTATLSDGSAPVYSDATVSTTGGHNAPIVYQLDFAAASAAQTLTVSWVLDEVVGSVSGGNSSTNNAALYA